MSEKIKFDKQNYMQIKDLIQDKRNYRKHNKKNLDLIKKSVKEVGLARSIVIDNENNIICGNGLTSTLDKNTPIQIIETDGTQLVVVKRTDLKTNDEKRKQLAIMDNSTSDSSEFDLDSLQADFDVEQLQDWGLDVEFEGLEEQEIIEDEVPEEVETKCKLGDIWQLGSHRLMCGDSTVITDVEKLMNGEKADMVFTDPPYGMKKEKDGVLNDNLNFDDLLEFNKEWIPLTFANTKENGSWYCWGIDEPLMDIYCNILKPMMKENEITFRNLITWDKGSGQGQLSKEFRMYPIADEKCLFVQCGINCLTLNADQYWEEYEPIRKYLYEQRIKCGWDISTMKTIVGHSDKLRDHWTSKSQWNLPTKDVYLKFQQWAKENNVKAFQKEYEQLRAEYEQLRAYFDNTHDNMNNVWHFPKTSQEERKQTGGHATPKPIALCSRAIKSSSRENETVLDVFGGSGSTLIACEQLGRKCYMMELDPHFCDVILQRYIKFKNSDEDVFLLKDGNKIPYSEAHF